MNLKDTYNKIAADWNQTHQTDDWWVEGTDRFVSFLKSGDLVLDVGCGPGTKSKYLTGKGLRVFGIDLADKFIEIARQKVPEAEFAVLDMQDAGKLEKDFDGIFAQASLLHIAKKDAMEVLRKLVAKLKPGGYLYVAVKEKRPGGADEEIKKENDYGYEYERFFSYYALDELKGYLHELGMELCDSGAKPSGRTNWIHVIGKKHHT
ncbi:MAG: class I SAM-dependent methyltransferase [Candidatus Sungbacteria bacterium]|nr:class I SAM-dependent methyltransferase [Candidatus Sungbacteria bacterium]